MKTEITTLLLKSLRADLDAAMAGIAQKHGITLKVGKGTYTSDSFTFKLEGVAIGGLSKEAQRYEAHQVLMALPPLGTEITIRGEKFTTAGINTTGTKVMIDRVSDGKSFLANIEAVRAKTGGDQNPKNANAYKLIKYSRALQAAKQMMDGNDLEPRSALKQAGSDFGIAYGDEMQDFVTWAEAQLVA